MTRDEAEKALQIARHALQDVGEDPDTVYIRERPGGWDMYIHGGSLGSLAAAHRAGALALSMVRPDMRVGCWTCAEAGNRRCALILPADVLSGVSWCGAAA